MLHYVTVRKIQRAINRLFLVQGTPIPKILLHSIHNFFRNLARKQMNRGKHEDRNESKMKHSVVFYLLTRITDMST